MHYDPMDYMPLFFFLGLITCSEGVDRVHNYSPDVPPGGYYVVEAASATHLLIQDTTYWSRLLCWKDPVDATSKSPWELRQMAPGAHLTCSGCGPWGGLYATDAQQWVWGVSETSTTRGGSPYSLWGCASYADEVMPRTPPSPFPSALYAPSLPGRL